MVKRSPRDLLHSLYHRVCDMPAVRERAARMSVGSRYRRWCDLNPCPEFPDRVQFFTHLFESRGLGGPIHYLEFGVWEGESIRWWVERNTDPGSTFHGFDSFEGLPTNWEGMPRGAFSTGGHVPDIADPRCDFIVGHFQDVLIPWLSGRILPNRRVINLDADLYGSTLFVLLHLLPLLRSGDILMFDEFHSYQHEFRALEDAIAARPIPVRALSRSNAWAQVGLEVL
jgi:O-methyltransferase